MGLGLWRVPYFVRAVRKEGPLEGYNIAASKHWGYLQMFSAASKLPPIEPSPAKPSVEVHFLSGPHHAFQTIFCAYSLQMHCPDVNVTPVIHEDGTPGAPAIEQIRCVMPGALAAPEAAAVEGAREYLPPQRYPWLWKTRERYVHLRKLIDVHTGAPGWKLCLDSDMLFHSRPDALLSWLQSPDLPVCMTDVMNAYGYEEAALAQYLNAPLPDFVNVGVCGLNREGVDWDRLEYWCRLLVGTDGLNYFLEQALTAMLFSETPFRMMPRKDYIVFPIREQMLPVPKGVLHHYVADSRTFLYRFGWRSIREAAMKQV